MISEEQKARLLKEKDELSERIEKLDVFIESQSFLSLSDEMQFLLEAQHRVMQQYESILFRRMTLLGVFEVTK